MRKTTAKNNAIKLTFCGGCESVLLDEVSAKACAAMELSILSKFNPWKPSQTFFKFGAKPKSLIVRKRECSREGRTWYLIHVSYSTHNPWGQVRILPGHDSAEVGDSGIGKE